MKPQTQIDLSLVDGFLKICIKQHFISYPVDIFSLLERQGHSVSQKLIRIDEHPLGQMKIPRKHSKYKLYQEQCLSPKINTKHFY